MTSLGVIFPPDLPPEELRAVATAADAAGLAEVWLWEDCFKESGIATAAAILGWTQRISVGIGLLPAPLRNVALTAMELATLARLFPGRILPGVGHGVQDWMGQVGAKVDSPMTLLAEYTSALRSLLAGERVTVAGRYVRLDGVALDWPPDTVPPVLVGAVGPRTVELAGRSGDGVIATGDTDTSALAAMAARCAAARAAAGRSGRPGVVAFLPVDGSAEVDAVAPLVAGYAAAGADHIALLEVGDDVPPLAEWITMVATALARDLRAG